MSLTNTIIIPREPYNNVSPESPSGIASQLKSDTSRLNDQFLVMPAHLSKQLAISLEKYIKSAADADPPEHTISKAISELSIISHVKLIDIHNYYPPDRWGSHYHNLIRDDYLKWSSLHTTDYGRLSKIRHRVSRLLKTINKKTSK
jgi:hypothetical protein